MSVSHGTGRGSQSRHIPRESGEGKGYLEALDKRSSRYLDLGTSAYGHARSSIWLRVFANAGADRHRLAGPSNRTGHFFDHRVRDHAERATIRASPNLVLLLLPMQAILTRYKIDAVWHFTDRSNLALIQEHQGLLSLAESRRRGVKIPVPGGNNWSHDADAIKGVDEYVHLAFLDDHPMLFVARQDSRIADPVWLKIDASILLEEGTRFTNDVSNKSGVEILTPDAARDMIDFEVLFMRTDWNDPEIRSRRKAAIKSEILVPTIVPFNKILSIKNG